MLKINLSLSNSSHLKYVANLLTNSVGFAIELILVLKSSKMKLFGEIFVRFFEIGTHVNT